MRRLSWDLCEVPAGSAREASHPFADHGYPFEQMGGAQSLLPTFLINFHKVDDGSRLHSPTSRACAQVPRAFGQLMDHVRRSAAAGIRPPRFAMKA